MLAGRGCPEMMAPFIAPIEVPPILAGSIPASYGA
jgi:hypothetical protein